MSISIEKFKLIHFIHEGNAEGAKKLITEHPKLCQEKYFLLEHLDIMCKPQNVNIYFLESKKIEKEQGALKALEYLEKKIAETHKQGYVCPLIHMALRTPKVNLNLIKFLIENNYVDINETDALGTPAFLGFLFFLHSVEYQLEYSKTYEYQYFYEGSVYTYQYKELFEYLLSVPKLDLKPFAKNIPNTSHIKIERPSFLKRLVHCHRDTEKLVKQILGWGFPIEDTDVERDDYLWEFRNSAGRFVRSQLDLLNTMRKNEKCFLLDHLVSSDLHRLNAYCPQTKNTALHFAIEHINIKYGEALIKAGVRVDLKNNNNETAMDLLFNSKEPHFVFLACLKYLEQIKELLHGNSSIENKNEATRLFKKVIDVVNGVRVGNGSEKEIKRRLKETSERKEQKDLKDAKEVNEKKENKESKESKGDIILSEVDRNILCADLRVLLMDPKSIFYKPDLAYIILSKITQVKGFNFSLDDVSWHRMHDSKYVSALNIALQQRSIFQMAQAALYQLLDSGKIKVETHQLKDQKLILREKIKFYYLSRAEDIVKNDAHLKKMMLEYTESNAVLEIEQITGQEEIGFILTLLDDLLNKSRQLRQQSDTIKHLQIELELLKIELLQAKNLPKDAGHIIEVEGKLDEPEEQPGSEEPDADPFVPVQQAQIPAQPKHTPKPR